MFGVSRELGISLLLLALIGSSLGVACIGDSNNGENDGDSPTPPSPSTPSGTDPPH